MSVNVAFIGTVGVPNKYGGFEMFLESCAPKLLERYNEVLITCDSSRYEDRNREWQRIRRVFVPVSANGALSVLHDLLAFLAVFWRAQVIIVLGVSGGIFFPLFRALCGMAGKRLIVNVDGVEWRRAKFSRKRRWFLYISDRLAQLFSHTVVVDNEALRPFLVKSVQQSAVLIAYPGDHVLAEPYQKSVSDNLLECLTICRIEPENNCHLLIEAFAAAKRGRYVFIGNWRASAYGLALRERFADVPGLEMRDPVYDKNILANLRGNCDVYLHGHSVGGTNPSLVEMLFYDCSILAFDCAFNRSTSGDATGYFASADDLAAQITALDRRVKTDRRAVRARYTRYEICNAYARLIGHAHPLTSAFETEEQETAIGTAGREFHM
ncbi:DUF1972 domain-containing protein [Massilia varians]|uniref:DUF1972 domain-containing protein n=1 Tax=Massilia varians TaxID=457921 RepID=UPI002554D259|nr:DUF1972 domain-containing protein [Massilia varians]MDK6079265.1 DUF1972 domain-containing protein [Massilia varians]